MELPFQRGFAISIILHGGLIAMLLCFAFFQTCSKEKERIVFELHTVPQPKTKAVVKKEIIQPRVEKAAEKVVAKEEKQKPVKEVPKKKVVQSKLKAEVAKMTYEEFIKKEGEPKVKEKKVAQTTAIKAPKLDVPNLKNVIERAIAPLEGKITEDLNLAYCDWVRSRVDKVWEHPRDFSNYNQGAIIMFRVLQDGKLGAVTLKRSSGCGTFDKSVLSAFSKVDSFGVPPSGVCDFELTFMRK